MDLAEQANDFIGSRNWQITCTSMSYGLGGSCSWEDSPGDADYRDFSESPDWWPDTRDYFRVHYLEFKGWINIPANGLGDPDYEGDTGAGLLSFYHAYNLGRYTGLEVQYTTDPYGVGPANWQPVPGPDPANPAGIIRDRMEGNDTSRLVMEQELVSLGDIPATRFRLRFAMLVRGSAYLRDGWWIDEIRIEREGLPKYLDYPFIDGAEEGIQNWQTIGNWGRTNEVARTDAHSYTDSPGADSRYSDNTNTALQTRWAIDLYNDTPGNLDLFDRNNAGGNSNVTTPNTIAPPAQNPVLTFYHRRDLTWSDNLHVEFRFATDDVNNWRHLWSYIHRMGTTRGEWSSRSETQLAWERVEIDLSVIMRQLTGAPGAGTGDALRDDDIFIRFRLETDGGSTDDGVWLDDIRIEERVEMVHRLWTMGTNPVIGGQTFGNGNGTRFFDDLDNGDWFNRWHRGGGWNAIEWEQNSGIYAFHESPQGQIAAPNHPEITVIPGSPVRYEITERPIQEDGSTAWEGSAAYPISSPDDSFHVLEMQTIIDLRAMLEDDAPTLYFWNRYYPGRQDRISVEVSYELTGTQANIDSYMGDKCRSSGRLQCYEHIYGWSEWEEVWYMREFEKAFGWEREAVDLSDYAAEDLDTPGQRIRIRFVYDALDNNDNRDGWYIDDVQVGPRQDDVVHILSLGGFFRRRTRPQRLGD
ncbi:hypothetical protein HC928_22645 [bacterium]|nr:hypothetical protein [bacterium]